MLQSNHLISRGLCAATFLLASTAAVSAQSPQWGEDGRLLPLENGFPSAPIRIWNVQAPGHVDEAEARVLSSIVSDMSPVPIVVESNAVGPAIHLEWFNRLPTINGGTDGYHVAVGSINGVATRLLTFDTDWTVDDLQDGTLITTGYTANLLIVPANSDMSTVEALVQYAQENPEQLRIATCQAGCGQHITLEQFSQTAGFTYRPIPHQGTPQAVLTLQGGGVEAATASPSYVLPLFEDGTVRPLIQWGPQRSANFPDVPTATEMGYGAGVPRSTGLLTHPSVPDAEKDWLIELFRAGYESDAYRAFAQGQDLEYLGLTGEESDQFIAELYDTLRPITIQLGLATERNAQSAQ